jgi:predicted dithiol-disulfide oxidoreductase (DUF899 family)
MKACYLRQGDRVFETYWTTGRGVEVMAPSYGLLDMTVYGRQEDWEDSPEGYPQTPPYQWWNWHDEYGDASPPESWVSQVERGVRSFDRLD